MGLAEQAVAVAVTKRTGLTSVFLSSLICIVCFQNCAVELSDETYGAAGICEPTDAQEADFALVLTDFFQNTGTIGSGQQACGQCHLTDSGNPAANTFGILPDTDFASAVTNFCVASSRADDINSGYLQSSHPGGIYSTSDVETLIDWASTIE